MTRAIFAVIAALVSLALEPAQAVAAEAPWCAVTKEGDHWDCSYRSVAECQSNVVAGNRGWCNTGQWPSQHGGGARRSV